MQSGLQLFSWGEQSHTDDSRTYYRTFTLDNCSYAIGDCVCLFPEDEKLPHHVGRIVAAFVDSSPSAQDPHCIQVKWYERRVNLEGGSSGELEREKEVVELEDTDVNPIGCVSGKCHVVKAKSYGEAVKQVKDAGIAVDWFFCRGVFKQQLNSFMLYSEAEPEPVTPAAVPPAAGMAPKRANKRSARAAAAAMSHSEDVADSDEVLSRPAEQHKRQRVSAASDSTAHNPLRGSRQQQHHNDKSAASHQHADGNSAGGMVLLDNLQPEEQEKAKRKAVHAQAGKICFECGATSTPQWREGPAGPKTLCNACGVRYVRAQQRASKRVAAMGGKQVPAPSTPSSARLAQQQSRKASPRSADAHQRASSYQPVPSAANEHLCHHQQTTPARPMRHAAVIAANRTAAFARTGVFPTSEDDMNAVLQKQHSYESSNSADSTIEEVVYVGHHKQLQRAPVSQEESPAGQQHTPERPVITMPVPSVLPAPSSIQEVGMVSASSFALTATSQPSEPSLDEGIELEQADSTEELLGVGLANDELSDFAVLADDKENLDLQGMLGSFDDQDCLPSSAVHSSSLHPTSGDLSDVLLSVDRLKQQLPADAVARLVDVAHKVDQSAVDAAEADAALDAITQVYTAKQQEADRARDSALAAVNNMKSYMAELMQNYPTLEPSRLYEPLSDTDLELDAGCHLDLEDETFGHLGSVDDFISVME